MADVMRNTAEDAEARIVRIGDRAIDFETFLDLNVEYDMELQNGVMVKKMAAQGEHEPLYTWLFTLLYLFTKQKKLGVAGGSRTAVRIDEFHSRLPDLFFVRREHESFIQSRAVYGTPDLAVELVSPNDRPVAIFEVEADYRRIGVPEIMFIDQQKQRVRILRKRGTEQGTDYTETILTEGELAFETAPGFVLQVQWLFAAVRPDELELITALLSA